MAFNFHAQIIADTEAELLTVLNAEEGQLGYAKDTNKGYRWDGAAWVQIPSGTGTASGTNTGDNSVNTLYSGLVSNATHTGDATGATALTVVKIQGKDFPALGIGDDQKYPKYNHGTNAFVMSAVTSAAADQNPDLLIQAADYNLLTNRGMVVPEFYEIGSGFVLDLAEGALLDVI